MERFIRVAHIERANPLHNLATVVNMIKIIRLSVLFTVLFLTPCDGYGFEQTPEGLVRRFYQWYLESDNDKKLVIFNDDIYHYVSRDTIKIVRHHRYSDVDYFTKVGFPLSRNNNFTVNNSINISNDIKIVHASFELFSKIRHIIIFIRREDGYLRISRVVDTYPY
jgi:hypothetical protein